MNRCGGVGRLAVAGIVAAGVNAARMPHVSRETVLPTARSAAEVVSPHEVAVDARTGHVFVTDGTVSAANGRVRMIDGATGAVLRTSVVGPSPRGLAVDARTGRVFVANWGRTYKDTGSVSVLNAATGAVLRTVTVGANPTVVTVDLTAGRAFVTNLYSVSVLDAHTGALVQTTNNGGGYSFTPVAVDEQHGRAFAAAYDTTMSGQPTLGENDVSVFNAGSGHLQRRIAVPRGPFAVAVDPRTGRLFTANIDGSVSIVDAQGRVRSVSVASRAFLNAVAVDRQTGHVFVTGYHDETFQGLVGVLDARSGVVLRTMAVSGTAAGVAVVERTGRAFVVAGPTISMLDARSGRVVRTLTIPADSVTVDERRGRVFVTGGDGDARRLDARSGTLFPTATSRPR